MKKICTVIALVASASLCACTPPRSAGASAPGPALTLDKVSAGFGQVKSFADLLLPMLSPARAAQIRAIEDRIDAALTAARGAKSLVDEIRALKEASAATVELERGLNP